MDDRNVARVAVLLAGLLVSVPGATVDRPWIGPRRGRLGGAGDPQRRRTTPYGADSMPETGENVAAQWRVGREEQDRSALASQQKTAAIASGRMAAEIVPVALAQRKGEPVLFDTEEHPRATSPDALARLTPVVRHDDTVMVGDASRLSDGAAAMLRTRALKTGRSA